MQRLTGIICAFALSGCASVAQPPAKCEGPQPAQQQIDDAVKTYLTGTNWKDPDSVRVRDIRCACRGRWRGVGVLAHGRTDNWEVDLDINAKNSYGGYTGFETKSISLAGVEISEE
jgi:hypothetical protein